MDILHGLYELIDVGSNKSSLPGGKGALDICGTGGDGFKTFNISTAAAIVCAAAGAKVIKHSGRASSGNSGSQDVLSTLGYNPSGDPYINNEMRFIKLYNQEGFISLYAAEHNSVLAGIAAARAKYAKPTVFNILAPLVNPATPAYRVVGLNAEAQTLMDKIHDTLRSNTEHFWLVSGYDGMDEISTTAPTSVIAGGKFKARTPFVIFPKDYGYSFSDNKDLLVTGPHTSARMIEAVFDNRGSDQQVAAVVMNAAAGLVVSGIADDYRTGIEIAKFVTTGGLAARKLKNIQKAFS